MTELEKCKDAFSKILAISDKYDGTDKLALAKDIANGVINPPPEMEEVERATEIAEANIRAEIADGGKSCHWCMDATARKTAQRCADWIKANWSSDWGKTIVEFEEFCKKEFKL